MIQACCQQIYVCRGFEFRKLFLLLGGASKASKILFCTLVLFSISIDSACARTYTFWYSGANASPRFQTPNEACDDLYHTSFAHLLYAYRPENSSYDETYGNGHEKFDCGATVNQGHFGSFFLRVQTCPNDEIYDFVSFSCIIPGMKGVNSEVASCATRQDDPDAFAGNPINIISGNKIQRDYDISPLGFSALQLYRTYNSLDGAWVHNFSAHLEFADDSIILIAADGAGAIFSNVDGAYRSNSNAGILEKIPETQDWLYTSPNGGVFYFRYDGRLVKYTEASGPGINISYQNSGTFMSLHIVSDLGKEMNITEDVKHQLLSASFDGKTLTYNYNYGALQSVSSQEGNATTIRRYIYDSPNGPGLTGIIDERGVRFATWTYDGLRRATSSTHAGLAGLTSLEYGAGYSKVQNALGKMTVYHYQKRGDINRIMSIEGEPSANCLASNSSYTYNARGQVLTKTDARGQITAYTYNDRGLETSRTEASGTPLALTVTTEWDPAKFLPVRVLEPHRTTVYSYDTQGRELSRQTTSH